MGAEKLPQGNGLIVTYTLFPNAFPTTCIERADVPWHDLCAKIHDAPVYISKRHCPLISLAAYGDQRTEKNCIRHAANVIRVYGIEIDYDGEQVTPEEGANLLRAAGLKAIVYTSPSHVDGAPRWRALLPLSEPALPSVRTIYVARANRALRGISTRESFTLSQSFYIGKVRGGTYRVIETEGRCIDLAADLEPLYYTGHQTDSGGRDMRSDEDLRRAFEQGEGRYEAMLKLSARWAAKGMDADDIAAALLDLLGNSPSNADGVDLRTRAEPLAASAVAKFGGRPWEPFADILDAPPVDLPPVEAYGDLEGEPADDTPETGSSNKLIGAGFWAGQAGTHTDLPYLVKGLFDRGQIIVLWGPPGSGKTFCALSMAAHIGAGRVWAGRRVKRGKVLYVCAESTRKRLENRTRALLDAEPTLQDAELFLVPLTLDLLRGDADILSVLAACEQLSDVALIVVDTLAVTFGGGDENSSEDMGQYVSNMKLLKERTGAAVLIVHHCGKDEARGMRGHSSLLGALDGELAIERPDPKDLRIFKAGKLREGESFCDLFTFDLTVRELGTDSDGDPVTTCYVATQGVGPVMRRPAHKAQLGLLKALEERRDGGEICWTEKEIREIAEPLMHRNSVRKAIYSLNEMGWLKTAVGGWMLSQETSQ